MKAKDRFINACFVVWGNRANGKKVSADSVLAKFHIGNNASKFINSIKGTPDECDREFFANLYQQYSDYCKEYRRSIVPTEATITFDKPSLADIADTLRMLASAIDSFA